MLIFAVLCLAAVALARPEGYSQTQNQNGVVTTVTERTFTIHGGSHGGSHGASHGESDKYYGTVGSSGSGYSGSAYNSGVSSYSSGSTGYAAKQGYAASSSAQPSYSFQTVATAVPVAQQQSYQSYETQQYQQAAPAYQTHQTQQYHQVQQAAPVYQAYQAAPAVAYHAVPVVHAVHAAVPVSYTAVSAAPAVAYQAAAPAYQAQANYHQQSYQAAAAAPAYQQQSYQADVASNVATNVASNAGVHSQSNYETSLENSQVSGTDTKIYKHVYAFAAPEEPSTRAVVRVQAPVSKRKHYKLVFIKAPQSQTIVDSDITLPAQEEEKTLIYVLSKNQKQVQPEIRIKQAAASKHAKPEVFFLKYKNEAEAQAIANGAISGQNADVPQNGEVISDGSVSILGQSSGSSGSSGSSFNSGSSFGSGSALNSGFESQQSAFDNSYHSGAVNSGASNVVYRGGYSGNNAGLSTVSVGAVGVVPVSNVGSVGLISDAPVASNYGSNFGGSSYYQSRSTSFSSGNQEPASVAIKVTSEPAVESYEATTVSSF